MKIIIAPDSFKGCLSASQVADHIENGIRRIMKDAELIKIPMADGGEGTVQALVDSTGGRIIQCRVKDPLLREIEAFYGILGDGKTAVIEMAAASGLPLLLKEERDPRKTSTYGTGELISHALDMGCKDILIGIGGSATNDGGAGMLQALGVQLLDSSDQEIGCGGENLLRLNKIDISKIDIRVKECNIIAACDVDNPLCGPKGAAAVFGPQKGADVDAVQLLDRALENFAGVIKRELGIDIKNAAGAGAAGGLGGGLLAFLGARLRKGIDIVIDAVQLEQKLADADLVITGEGMIDYQTAHGKTPYGVALAAKKYGIPVIAIAGGLGKEASSLYANGFDAIFSITDKPMALEEAMQNAGSLIEDTTERTMRMLQLLR